MLEYYYNCGAVVLMFGLVLYIFNTENIRKQVSLFQYIWITIFLAIIWPITVVVTFKKAFFKKAES